MLSNWLISLSQFLRFSANVTVHQQSCVPELGTLGHTMNNFFHCLPAIQQLAHCSACRIFFASQDQLLSYWMHQHVASKRKAGRQKMQGGATANAHVVRRSGHCAAIRSTAIVAHTQWMGALPPPCTCCVQCESTLRLFQSVFTQFSCDFWLFSLPKSHQVSVWIG